MALVTARIIAGLSSPARSVTGAYAGGVSPGAHLVNVRVLGDEGVGLTSGVIAGLDWVIANRTRYGIRIVNLSLGHGVSAPCALDPLCSSVQRLTDAGLIVVASAGNRGKTSDGRTVLGGITSPGNSPFAITVGALNTWSTVGRRDDTVTTYSSRGPTAYDFAVKPDVVAPGNKIISLEAQHSYLARNFPNAHVAGRGSNAYFQMSGTSMAAAMVSGGIALLAEAYPGLSAVDARYRLQTTASFMTADGLMAAGAGSVNIWSARRAAGTALLSALLPTSTIGNLLVTPTGAAFRDAGRLQTRLHQGTGLRLLGLLDAVAALLSPASLEWDRLHLVGTSNPIASASPHQILWGGRLYDAQGQQIIWADQTRWGDVVYDSEGQQIIWADSEWSEGNQIIWADSVTTGDPER
jgi:serine protease AprX